MAAIYSHFRQQWPPCRRDSPPSAGALLESRPEPGHEARRGAAVRLAEVSMLGFFAQPPDRVYSRDSTNQTHVGVPWIAKIKMTTCVLNRLYLQRLWANTTLDHGMIQKAGMQ